MVSGVLLVPLRPRKAADPHPFGKQGEGLQNLLFRSPKPIEESPFCLGKGLLATPAKEALPSLFGLALLLNVALPFCLRLAIIRASRIRTETSNLSQVEHAYPS